MKSNYNKFCIKSSGVIFILLIIAITIANLVLISGDFKFIHQNWYNNGYYRLIGIFNIVETILLIINDIFGFSIFSVFSEKKGLNLLYYIFSLLCAMYSISIGVINILSGSVGKSVEFTGCNKPLQGLFTYWNGVDVLLQKIDKKLCSSECLCDITSYTEKIYQQSINSIYLNNDVSSMYNIVTNKNQLNKINFQSCDNSLIQNVGSIYKNKENVYFSNSFKNFDLSKFMDYWSKIEKKFECSGFCNIEYIDEDLGNGYASQRKIAKYLFTDVNKGIPKHRCFPKLFRHLKRRVLSFGILTIIAGFCQICVTIFSFILFINHPIGGLVKEDGGLNEQELQNLRRINTNNNNQ